MTETSETPGYRVFRDGRWQDMPGATFGEALTAHYARAEAEAAATMTQQERVDRFVLINKEDGSDVRVIHEPNGAILCEVLKDGAFVRAAKRFHPDSTSEWV